MLVDGTESSIAAEAVNVSNAIALRESLERALGDRQLPVDARPRILFNPDTRSANFFIPGLMVVMCQMMATMLSANAIVREKELGTLEQLFMTPVAAVELIVGKMSPYLVLTTLEFCFIAFLMWSIFQRADPRPFLTLLALTFPFVLAMLGAGLLDFDEGLDARSGRPDRHGDVPAVDFSLGLRLSARFDAVAAEAGGQLHPDDLDDRRLAERDPPRRRLARALAARPRPVAAWPVGALIFGSLQVKKRL